MFSALKKLAGKNEPPPVVVPGNVQAMSSQLQRKFARGIQYNSEYRTFYVNTISFHELDDHTHWITDHTFDIVTQWLYVAEPTSLY